MIKFGAAGNPQEFYNRGFKKSEYMPQYLSELGLNAYEYQCSRGVKVSDEKAQALRNESRKYGISLSIHAPYYISLSTTDETKKINNIKYIMDTAAAAQKMGADRIIIHTGSMLGFDREQAMEYVMIAMADVLQELDKAGLSEIILCPETMGKIKQLGTSDEVIKICKLDKRLIPAIDFGHLYCRSIGTIETEEDWEKELKKYINDLGYEKMKNFHSHFSKMIYTDPGGEKCHVTFAEKDCGPDFTIVAKVLLKLQLEPRLICESAGTQSNDAKIMKEIYDQLKRKL